MQVKLFVTNKALNESNNYDLAVEEEKITIGRHLGSPVPLQGDRLSRHHFFLVMANGSLLVEDLSSNGTWLNGSLLKAKMSARVKSGDIIEIPDYEMRVMVQGTEVLQKPQLETPTAPPLKQPAPTWKQSLTGALHILEPREAALLFLAMASFALISFFLTH